MIEIVIKGTNVTWLNKFSWLQNFSNSTNSVNVIPSSPNSYPYPMWRTFSVVHYQWTVINSSVFSHSLPLFLVETLLHVCICTSNHFCGDKLANKQIHTCNMNGFILIHNQQFQISKHFPHVFAFSLSKANVSCLLKHWASCIPFKWWHFLIFQWDKKHHK
jgi:hypothetical protein